MASLIKRYGRILFLGAITVLVGALLLVFYAGSSGATNVCTQPGNVYLIKQASLLTPETSPGSAKKLTAIATSIKRLSGYNRDVNCLYVLFKTAEYTGNIAQEQTYLNDFERYYNQKSGVSPYFGLYVTPANLKNQFAIDRAASRYRAPISTLRMPK